MRRGDAAASSPNTVRMDSRYRGASQISISARFLEVRLEKVECEDCANAVGRGLEAVKWYMPYAGLSIAYAGGKCNFQHQVSNPRIALTFGIPRI